MSDEDIVLLREEFCLYPGKVKHNVWVTNNHIVVQQIGRGKTEEAIFLDDVIGCHVLHDKKQGDAAYLSVFSYPLKKKMLGSGVVRQRVARTFTINKRKTYQENLLLAETWKMTIKRLVSGEKIMTKEGTLMDLVKEMHPIYEPCLTKHNIGLGNIENGSLATRNLLVLVNPFSGRKKAINMYMEKVKPMFLEAEIKHTMRKTEYPGHAKEIAKELNLEDWDGVVIVSGDGLVHEVVNGLMDREDWRTAIKMPLGIVPGGSGNALAAAVVYASTGQILSNNLDLDAVFEVVKGKTRKLSVVAAETEAGQRFYSFLNFAWGFIADVDIESERYRALGPVRFTIGCAIRVANMRLYQGRISYLPVSTNNVYSFGRSQSYYHTSDKAPPALEREMSVPENMGSSIMFGGARKSFGRRSKFSGSEDAIRSDISLVNANIPERFNRLEDVNGSSESDNEDFEPNPSTHVQDKNDSNQASGDASNLSKQSSRQNDHSVKDNDNKNGDISSDKQSDDNDSDIEIISNDRQDSERASTASAASSNPAENVNGYKSNKTSSENHQTNETPSRQIAMSLPEDDTNQNNSTNNKDVKLVTPQAWKDSAILYNLRSSLDSSPPEDWVQIESEYVWVTSLYLSHLGNEMMGIPTAKLDEDIMYIYTLRHGISKTQLMNVLLGFEGGTHIERGGEFSSVIPCRAVRLEPFTFITGHMTVDGEVIPHCAIQASITPHKITLMSSVSEEQSDETE